MAKEKFNRSKPHVNVGTIGHIDHGKTTLTAALVKVQCEEGSGEGHLVRGHREGRDGPRRDEDGDDRGVARGVRERRSGTTRTSIAPGHADYIKNMITGAAQMDGAILVVSALDSVMPQTREHVLLARQVGLNHIVVFAEQVRRGGRRGDAGPGGDGGPRASEQVQVRRRQRRRSSAARRSRR